MENIVFQSIYHISELHQQHMFHGDIKPANIFFDNNPLIPCCLTSDSGSVVQLEREKKEKKYFINYYTPGFSSKKHILAIRNEIGETADELFQEDKH